MDKKIIIIIIVFTLFSIYSYAQARYEYQPLTQSQQADIDNLILSKKISSFIVKNRIPIGPINLTNVVNMVSYNPIEGTRIRISAETNNKMFVSSNFLKHRLALSVMGAYGLEDKKIKYGVGVSFNFASNSNDVYSFPCSTLSFKWEDNSYMPSYDNYDAAYLSYKFTDRFYLANKKQLIISFIKEYSSTIAFRPFVSWQKIDSYHLYNNNIVTELLDNKYNYTNKSIGIEFSYQENRKDTNFFNTLNSRFYSMPTMLNINYSYNMQSYKRDNQYHRMEISAQHRLLFSPLTLDINLTGGILVGKSDRYMYFTPNYMTNAISNTLGFNLYSSDNTIFKEYIQTFTQINFGGMILDNLNFLKKFRPNEFLNIKTLFTMKGEPYCEFGIGIDHIFAILGIEFITRLSKENPYNMPQYAVKVRCNL
ncbi:MAG: hypothetical protein ACTTJH_02745 [Bacteroidales bacterium]